MIAQLERIQGLNNIRAGKKQLIDSLIISLALANSSLANPLVGIDLEGTPRVVLLQYDGNMLSQIFDC